MRYRRSLFKLKLRKQTVYSILSLGLLGLAGMIVAATFFPQGIILDRINNLFSLYFGWGRALFAVTLMQIALLFSKVKISFVKLNVVMGYFLLVTALLSLSQTGTFGLTIFQTIYTFIPVSLAVFFILLIMALLGTTLLFNLSLGEVVGIFQDLAGKIKLPKKTIAPVFVKDTPPIPAVKPVSSVKPAIINVNLPAEKIIQNTPPELPKISAFGSIRLFLFSQKCLVKRQIGEISREMLQLLRKRFQVLAFWLALLKLI
ncbi:hypothetical protein HY085_00405 [Candidatus Gottesmanbacteria bacterium]|nr:hypothetical protein [Candidatus Gottesmanbacteria bacterium]